MLTLPIQVICDLLHRLPRENIGVTLAWRLASGIDLFRARSVARNRIRIWLGLALGLAYG